MLADVVLRRNLDVVNIQYQAAAYNMHVPAINLAPWRLRGLSTVVVTFHDLRVPYLLPKAGPLRSYVVRLLARSAHGVIATNREDYVTLRSWDIADDRLQQIPIGSNIARRTFDEEELTRLREKLGIAPGTCLVGYFGFLSESKGADTLLRAIAANGPQVHLLFIGGRAGDSARSSDERFAGQLDALIDELGVGDRVHRTGYVDAEEVSAYLQTCDVIVLPYRDGVSFRRGTLMAALTHGKAIVSTEPPIDEPLLQHGRNIWLVARESDKALGTAVGDLCANADLRQQLEDGASELAQRFDWSGIAAATAEFFFALRRAQRA
jgi:glycosyltransferase involved in cell wall biosynthesis